MSATRDKNQKITFVYSNLYSIYRKGLEKAREGAAADSPLGLIKGSVIKTEQLSSPTSVRVTPYTAAELMGKRISKPAALKESERAPFQSLKQNLSQLNDLQARLRFMLQELEELVKE